MAQLLVPQQFIPTGDSFQTHPRRLKQWLKDLDLLADAAYSRELYRGMKHANRLQFDKRLRLDMLEWLQPRVSQLIQSYEQQTSDFSHSNVLRNQRVFTQSLNLYRELSFGYKHVLIGHEGPFSRLNNKYKTLTAERILTLVGETALFSARHYRQPSLELWQDLCAAFLMTLQQGTHQKTLLNPHINHLKQRDCQTAFLHSVLFLTLKTEHLRSGEADAVYESLYKWVPLIKISTQPPKYSNLDNVFAIDLKNGLPAENARFFKSSHHEDCIWLDLSAVKDKIADIISKSPELDQSSSPAQPISPTSLRSLLRIWHPKGSRDFARGIRNEAVFIETGIKDIHARLLYPDSVNESTQKASHDQWFVTNYSRGGLGLSCQSVGRQSLSVGDLIAIHESSTQRWRIGTIRWLKINHEGRGQCGVQMISGHPVSVLAERHHGRARDEITLRECIMFSSQDNSFDSLAVPVQNFRFGEKTKLIHPDGKKTSVRLVERLSLGGLYSHYQIRQDDQESWVDRSIVSKLNHR